MIAAVFEIVIAAAPLILKWNLFLSTAALATFAVSAIVGRFGSTRTSWISNSGRQLLLRGVLIAALLPPLASALTARFIAPANIFAPSVQVAAADVALDPKGAARPQVAFVMSQAPNRDRIRRETQTVLTIALGLLFVTLVAGLRRVRRIYLDRRQLKTLIERSFRLRKLGRVEIFVSREVSVPFATRLRQKSLVIVPETLLAQPKPLNLAIRHELQHHRQRDLQWNVLLEGARVIAGWNPLVSRWLERIEETDELACDENLLGRGRIDVMDYATCLYEVAVIAQTTGGCARLVGTAGMATSPQFLKRRIAMTLEPKSPTQRKVTMRVLTTAIVLAIAGSAGLAWASEGLVKDRRISMAQAQTLAKKAQGGIPIVINKRVLNFLNLATSTPRTRFYMRNVLKRMKIYKPMISAKLKAAGLTEDLMAIPAVEGGFQNIETMTSAGIWQFVPETARRFGLKVDDTQDDRLDPEKETDAAIAYLSGNYAMFSNDWNLALLSYNQGEKSVRDIVQQTGIRDVFRLADEGYLKNDECANYVPKLMAALIIMANPDLANE